MGSIINVEEFNSNERGQNCSLRVKINSPGYRIDPEESLGWHRASSIAMITYDAYPGGQSDFVDWVDWPRDFNEQFVVIRVVEQGSQDVLVEFLADGGAELDREVLEHDPGGN